MALPYDAAELQRRDPIQSLFDLALGLTPPWRVVGFMFDPDRRPTRHPGRLRASGAVRLPGVQGDRLPGARHHGQRVASSHPELKYSRYWWLRRPSKLTAEQQRGLAEHRRRYRTMARAYQLKLEFDELCEQPADDAELYLTDWCLRVFRSRLPLDPLKRFVDTLVVNWERILRWFQSRISNGILEAINSLVRAAKRRARGYRSDRHYIAMI